MLCENCGIREAAVHITEIVNEKTVEMHLCEICAKEKGVMGTQAFSLADLLAGLMDLGVEVTAKEGGLLKSCPSCGMTFEDFKKTGRFGCAQCYETFKESIIPLLQKIHGSMRHFGKAPKKISLAIREDTELQQLQGRLKEAIEKEEFEEAAKIRDRIKELQKKRKK
jgi:protein arginine kinase activator